MHHWINARHEIMLKFLWKMKISAQAQGLLKEYYSDLCAWKPRAFPVRVTYQHHREVSTMSIKESHADSLCSWCCLPCPRFVVQSQMPSLCHHCSSEHKTKLPARKPRVPICTGSTDVGLTHFPERDWKLLMIRWWRGSLSNSLSFLCSKAERAFRVERWVFAKA